MYYKPDENCINRLYENRKNITAGRISHGYSDIIKYHSDFGVIAGLFLGVILILPQIAERNDKMLLISYDNFWPAFITFIILTIAAGIALDKGIKYHSLKKMIYNPNLMIDNGTILYTTINNRAVYGVIGSDYKTPVPHFISMPYLNPKKPRSLKVGTRVFILITPDSIAIISMADITGAPGGADISYQDAYNIKDLVLIYHPKVFEIDSTPEMITEENRPEIIHKTMSRTLMSRCLNMLKAAAVTFGVMIFIIIIFYDMIPLSLKFQIIGSIIISIIAAMIVWMFSTFKIIAKINKADCVRTVMIELPKSNSWTGNYVVQVMDGQNGDLARSTYDLRNCMRGFNYFDTAQVFYKKNIDAVQSIC